MFEGLAGALHLPDDPERRSGSAVVARTCNGTLTVTGHALVNESADPVGVEDTRLLLAAVNSASVKVKYCSPRNSPIVGGCLLGRLVHFFDSESPLPFSDQIIDCATSQQAHDIKKT